jgi:prepilin-type N-terminal cleavage/methylation domain-containing protein
MRNVAKSYGQRFKQDSLAMKNIPRRGVTILELMVVLVIISILSTVAVGVYSKEILRARYAKTRAEIHTLELAITRYEIDTGQYPPSGSGSTIAPSGITTSGTARGSGYLQLALRNSLNNDPYEPLSSRWKGPYVEWDYNRLGLLDGTPLTDVSDTVSPGNISFLDPFGYPYYYIRSSDYETRGGTELDSSSPFYPNETYYNPSTFQIISLGPNGQTYTDPGRGLEADDVSNFLSPNY